MYFKKYRSNNIYVFKYVSISGLTYKITFVYSRLNEFMKKFTL